MSATRVYSPEVDKLLAFVDEMIVDGLKHGFFELSIECDKTKGELREVVVKAGRTYKFNVPADRVPQ